MASVTFEHVVKRYGDVVAVNDLNISRRRSRIPGAGRPLGLRQDHRAALLAGLEEITDGNIHIGDRVVNDVPPKDRDIAMVFQSYALYPHMSVYDNMAFGLKLRKTPKAEIDQRVKEAADMRSASATCSTASPRQLSGGQRQRVAVGRAIVRNPAVFLMDEPLSNLDAKLRVQTRAEISKLHQRLKTTFIYVTHDQVEAMTMGTRIAVMKDGVLQQLDTPQVLYDHPDNMFVAGFIGSPSMNFFDATLDRQRRRLLSSTLGAFRLPLPDEKAEPRSATMSASRSSSAFAPRTCTIAHYVPRGVDEAAKLDANVTVVEPLGSEVYAYVENGGKEMVRRARPAHRRSRRPAGRPGASTWARCTSSTSKLRRPFAKMSFDCAQYATGKPAS